MTLRRLLLFVKKNCKNQSNAIFFPTKFFRNFEELKILQQKCFFGLVEFLPELNRDGDGDGRRHRDQLNRETFLFHVVSSSLVCSL